MIMKTILFFDRSNLTKLYILLTKELRGSANVIHVAYSQHEVNLLKDAGITDYIDYHKRFSELVDSLSPNDGLIREIDEMIIKQSKGEFSLNSSIQNDRGYTILSYPEALLLACCHYKLWKEIYDKQHVDYMYHELASQFMTHIAGLLCKHQGGEFIYQTQLTGDRPGYHFLNLDGETFECHEIEKNYKYYTEHPEEIDIERCKTFIEKFRSEYKVAFGNIVKPPSNKLSLFKSSLKTQFIQLIARNRYDKLKNNIDYWLLRNNIFAEKINNLRQYKKNGIKFSLPVDGEKYFYYSFHLEPEAVVLYQGGGLYVNQVKLIENIAASLPAGYYLYVKDHPHEFAYRKVEDYVRLMKVPNIRLIDQSIPGKSLIKNAVGVLTIVGTAGFEGLVLGKQVYGFGSSYYTATPRVSYVKNIRSLRSVIYSNMSKDYADDQELYAYIYSYLLSLHDGFVNYFGKDRIVKSGIDENENAKLISNGILDMIENRDSYTNL